MTNLAHSLAGTVVALAPTVRLGWRLAGPTLQAALIWDPGIGVPCARVLLPLAPAGPGRWRGERTPRSVLLPYTGPIDPDAPLADALPWPGDAPAALLLLLFDEASFIVLRGARRGAPRQPHLLRGRGQSYAAAHADRRELAALCAIDTYLDTAALALGSPGLLVAA
jgi:hypothetical protein